MRFVVRSSPTILEPCLILFVPARYFDPKQDLQLQNNPSINEHKFKFLWEQHHVIWAFGVGLKSTTLMLDKDSWAAARDSGAMELLQRAAQVFKELNGEDDKHLERSFQGSFFHIPSAACNFRIDENCETTILASNLPLLNPRYFRHVQGHIDRIQELAGPNFAELKKALVLGPSCSSGGHVNPHYPHSS